jgi:hypothetical protein
MFIQPIDYLLAAWFVLAFLSTAYVAVDQYRNNPEPQVMKWGFILVTLYLGPVGLLLYVLADKEPVQNPGKWLLHCHIPHHTTNNNVEEKGGGGLMLVIDVKA